MSPLVIAPLLCFCLLFLASWRRSSEPLRTDRWRTAFLTAAIIWGVLLTVFTEGLSLLRLLTHEWIFACWSIACLGTLASLVRGPAQLQAGALVRSSFSGTSALLAAGLALVLSLTGLVALLAPPNNWDSHVYHMARTIHWEQNQSVAHYPTHITRQLRMNPWAEFATTHVRLLSGDDRLVNLVQWFSMLGSLVAVSLIARQLGAGRTGQIFSAIVCATIPMGILQATTTQNDYATAFWLACFAYYTLVLLTNAPTWGICSRAGASLGLAILTKGTIYLYAGPFVALYLIPFIRSRSIRASSPLFIIPVVIVSLNFGHYFRNYELYGDLLGVHVAVGNSELNAAVFGSNLLRNVVLHTATPNEGLNSAINRGVLWAHEAMGLSPTALETTFLSYDILDLQAGEAIARARQPITIDTLPLKFRQPIWAISEHRTSNTAHLLLAAASIASVLSIRRFRDQRAVVLYMGCLVAGLFLFCLLLKWQAIHSRLHLPLFVLGAAAIGTVLGDVLRPRLVTAAGLALLVLATPWLLFSTTRPLVGERNVFNTDRLTGYFAERLPEKSRYQKVAEKMAADGCREVGLVAFSDIWEYPLWAVLRESLQQDVHIEHVNVKNLSRAKSGSPPYSEFAPCAVIAFDPGLVRSLAIEYGVLDHFVGWCQERFSRTIDCSYVKNDFKSQTRYVWNNRIFRREQVAGRIVLFTRRPLDLTEAARRDEADAYARGLSSASLPNGRPETRTAP